MGGVEGRIGEGCWLKLGESGTDDGVKDSVGVVREEGNDGTCETTGVVGGESDPESTKSKIAASSIIEYSR